MVGVIRISELLLIVDGMLIGAIAVRLIARRVVNRCPKCARKTRRKAVICSHCEWYMGYRAR